VPGLLDMLLGAPANTGTGSQPANQNGPSASTLQAAAPFIGNGFNLGMPANGLFTTGQQAQQPLSFAQLLQSLMSAKEPQPPSPYGPEGFGSPGYAPTPEPCQSQCDRSPANTTILPTAVAARGNGHWLAERDDSKSTMAQASPTAHDEVWTTVKCQRVCGCDCLRVLTFKQKGK
jgi:hypothetical protein